MGKSEVNWGQSCVVTTAVAQSITHLSDGTVQKGEELFWGYISFGNKNKSITISCSTTENKQNQTTCLLFDYSYTLALADT